MYNYKIINSREVRYESKCYRCNRFAGAELLRLLDGHPQAELAYITSESSTGEDIAAMYPHLRGRIDKQLISMNELEKLQKAVM